MAACCFFFLLLSGRAEAAPSQSILYTGQAHFAFNHEPYSAGEVSEHGGYTFKWEMSASGDLASGTVHWNLIRLEGGWNYEGQGGGGSYECHGGFAYRPGAELPLVFVSESSPCLRTGSGSDTTDEYLVQVRAPTEVTEQTELEHGEMPESCWSGPGSPYFYSALGTDLNFPAEGTYTVPVESSSTYTNGEGPCMYVSNGPCEASDTVTSQVTFSAGGIASATQVGPTAPPVTGSHPPRKEVRNKDKRKRTPPRTSKKP